MSVMPAELAGRPILILKEGTTRQRGRDVQRANILVARTVADVLRATLGPRGMDKMLVDSLGDVTITNDGATILDEMEVEHPVAKMLVEAAKAQDKEVGDGTTTIVVLVGELLKKAEELINQNVHPTLIASGYRKALDKAIETLRKLSIPVDLEDRETLRKLAKTAMYSKSVRGAIDHLADIAIDAVKQITEERGGKKIADIDQIQIIKKVGESLFDTQLVRGVIIDKEVVHPGMPKRVENAKIALIDCPLEIEKTEFSAEIRITDPEKMKAFLDEETRVLKEMVDKIKSVGANVVFCQKGIDDVAQHFLAKEKIMAVRRVKKSDMEKLARATGARIVTDLDSLKESDLGEAALVEERKVAGDKIVFVEGCKDPKSLGILLRGGLERFVDEAERSLHDALCIIADIVRDNRMIAGGGSSEVEVAKVLRQYAVEVGGREQLAIEAFADALEIIPRTLAENAGLDPIDVIVALRSKHAQPGNEWVGIDIFTGEHVDMMKAGIIEPLCVKENALRSAVEIACTILRIDDMIAAAKPVKPEKAPTPPKPTEKEKEE